jgi:hypothetical protein
MDGHCLLIQPFNPFHSAAKEGGRPSALVDFILHFASHRFGKGAY